MTLLGKFSGTQKLSGFLFWPMSTTSVQFMHDIVCLLEKHPILFNSLSLKGNLKAKLPQTFPSTSFPFSPKLGARLSLSVLMLCPNHTFILNHPHPWVSFCWFGVTVSSIIVNLSVKCSPYFFFFHFFFLTLQR